MGVFLGLLTAFLLWHAASLVQGKTKSKTLLTVASGVVVFGLVMSGLFGEIIAVVITAGAISAWWETWKNRNIHAVPPKNPSPVFSQKNEPHITIADTAETESARRRSLSAMKRATEARQRDVSARGEKPAQNIYNSQYLADIEFDYRDASDNASHRRVGVETVDDEYFEGFCHKAADTRTFVIGRVRGKILDRESGELLPPRQWAAGVRNDVRNSGVVMNRGWKPAENEGYI